MSDSELLRLLRAIDGHNRKVSEIIERIAQSDRPDADAIARSLREQCHSLAWAEHVGGHYLGESWVNEGGTYVRKAKV